MRAETVVLLFLLDASSDICMPYIHSTTTTARGILFSGSLQTYLYSYACTLEPHLRRIFKGPHIPDLTTL